ncbi:hypothetical protein L1987_05403 [Smallanthus sonchifolius]|uniref:Uncharacterized protein n=1 Tax=Smallanthus sonchifolius TaxID=185202 RepID=A0ACB9JVC9_9ASTR|nr:hypothetical protein L1987_05403 [Smallanthus sonchifolius]
MTAPAAGCGGWWWLRRMMMDDKEGDGKSGGLWWYSGSCGVEVTEETRRRRCGGARWRWRPAVIRDGGLKRRTTEVKPARVDLDEGEETKVKDRKETELTPSRIYRASPAAITFSLSLSSVLTGFCNSHTGLKTKCNQNPIRRCDFDMVCGLIDLNIVSDEAEESSSTNCSISGFGPGSGCGSGVCCLELWHSCARPSICLPRKGNAVVYCPQGHLEQLQSAGGCLTGEFTVPPHVFCRVLDVKLHAEVGTDDVYAQVSLIPDPKLEQKWREGGGGEEYTEDDNGVVERTTTPHMFCKTLTASDTCTHGGFSVPRRATEDCFPSLDYKEQRPSQELVAKDLHGTEWKFRHIYRGQPRRHLLTTGWSAFVNKKKLVCGDAVLFLRGDDGVLRGGSSEFIVPYNRFLKSLASSFSPGASFKMRIETEDAGDPRQNRVSPWEIERCGLISDIGTFVSPLMKRIRTSFASNRSYVSSNFAESMRFHKVLQGQEIYSFHRCSETSQPENDTRNLTSVGFGESLRFNRDLQGQEILSNLQSLSPSSVLRFQQAITQAPVTYPVRYTDNMNPLTGQNRQDFFHPLKSQLEEPVLSSKNSWRLFGFSLTEGCNGTKTSRCPNGEDRVVVNTKVGVIGDVFVAEVVTVSDGLVGLL